jgi:hypothetical protein
MASAFFSASRYTRKQLCVPANLSQVKSRTSAGAMYVTSLEAKTGKHVFIRRKKALSIAIQTFNA